MHAMQAVPLFALLLPAHLSKNYGYALVAAFSAVYVAFSLATFLQALEGQPFIVRLGLFLTQCRVALMRRLEVLS